MSMKSNKRHSIDGFSVLQLIFTLSSWQDRIINLAVGGFTSVVVLVSTNFFYGLHLRALHLVYITSTSNDSFLHLLSKVHLLLYFFCLTEKAQPGLVWLKPPDAQLWTVLTLLMINKNASQINSLFVSVPVWHKHPFTYLNSFGL